MSSATNLGSWCTPGKDDTLTHETGADQAASHYDRAFQPAVAAGLLTTRQAIDRGKRDAFAERIVQRHGIEIEVALEVADNRTSLGDAIRDHGSEAIPTDPSPAAGRRSPAWYAVAVGVLVLLVVAGAARLAPGQSEAHVWHQVGDARVMMLDNDVAVRIDGPDPLTVLQAYLGTARRSADHTLLGLVRSPRAAPRLRIGVYEDAEGVDRLSAIAIRQDPQTLVWSTGDGLSPIATMRAPSNAAASIEPIPE